MPRRLETNETGEPVQGPVAPRAGLRASGRTRGSKRGAAALDVPNLTLELDGLIERDERALGSQLKRIMAHLLKQQVQAQRASRSWIDSIENGREEIAGILEQSLSLRRTLPGLMPKNYRRAVAQASRDTRLPMNHFPAQPPFTLAEVLPKQS